jgi:hypothetical protein
MRKTFVVIFQCKVFFYEFIKNIYQFFFFLMILYTTLIFLVPLLFARWRHLICLRARNIYNETKSSRKTR